MKITKNKTGFIVGLLVAAAARVATADVFDPPTSYYSTATSTVGATLKTQLRSIVSVNTPVNYGDARYSVPFTDVDPNNSANFLSVYTRLSLSSVWDSGVTWNREHTWPQSRLGASASNGTANIASDQFSVRPSRTADNGSRGNNSYGGTYGSGAPFNNSATALYYPGDVEAGDVARAAFYMATRWSALTLVNGTGTASLNQMGDLAQLLQYHYADVPDTFERRRNHAVFGSAGATGPAITNPYKQSNRNPYVDHPEWVWAVYGDGANDSRISVGTAAADGSSSQSINFGRVIVGAPAPTLTSSVTLNKAGVDPTYYTVTTAGLATSTVTGFNNAFRYNTGSRAITVGLTANTATVGVQTGTVTVDNTDITNAGTGTGALDGNDVINLSLTVVNRSNASFSASSDVNVLNLWLGDIDVGQSASLTYTIANLGAIGLTAGLDVDSVTETGELSMFSTNLTTLTNLPAGTPGSFSVTFTPGYAGVFSASYAIANSDENISGALSGTPLTLNVSGFGVVLIPEPATPTLIGLCAATLTLRRRHPTNN